MLILFLSIVFSVLMLAFKQPIAYIACYSIYIGAFFYFLKKKKNENMYFYLVAVAIIGLGFYLLFLSPTKLAGTLAEEATKASYGDYIYRNTSYNAVDITAKGGGKYYVTVAVYAGKFFIRNFYETVRLPILQVIISYAFLVLSTGLLLYSLFNIIFEKKNIVKTEEYTRFIKAEKQKKFIDQIIGIMVINVLMLLLFTNEMYTMYGTSSGYYEKGDYLGLISLYSVMVGRDVVTNYGTLVLHTNILFILTYLALIASIVLINISKKDLYKKESKSALYVIISSGLFLLSTVGLLFTNKIINYSFNNKVLSEYKYIYASNNTGIFQIYRIASAFVILAFYGFLLYKTLKKNKKVVS